MYHHHSVSSPQCIITTVSSPQCIITSVSSPQCIITTEYHHHSVPSPLCIITTVYHHHSVSSVCLCMVHAIVHSKAVLGIHWINYMNVCGGCPLVFFQFRFHYNKNAYTTIEMLNKCIKPFLGQVHLSDSFSFLKHMEVCVVICQNQYHSVSSPQCTITGRICKVEKLTSYQFWWHCMQFFRHSSQITHAEIHCFLTQRCLKIS